MSIGGTAAYDHVVDLPPLVDAAVAAARRDRFGQSCLPQQGRLLRVLAGGVGAGTIGETGTGCGVGLAWLASGADPGARLFGIDRDPARVRTATGVFADEPRIRVRLGDWRELARHAPFDLLVLDGGGQGKADDPPLDPARWLRRGGTVVLDDFTPMTTWPPRHAGRPDAARLYWLDHPRLRAVEVRVAPGSASIIGTYLG